MGGLRPGRPLGRLGQREVLRGQRCVSGSGAVRSPARQESKPCCCTGVGEVVVFWRCPSRRVEAPGVSVHVRNQEICYVAVQREAPMRFDGAGSRESCWHCRTPRAGSAGSPASVRAGGAAGSGWSGRRSGAWCRGGAVRVDGPRLLSDVLMPGSPRRGREVGLADSPIVDGRRKSGWRKVCSRSFTAVDQRRAAGKLGVV